MTSVARVTTKRNRAFRRPARGGPAGVLAASALALALLAGPVGAAPGPAVDPAGLIEDELGRARTELGRLAVEAARAVEAYNGAQVRARQAAAAADDARADVAAAGVAVEKAHDDLGRLASEAYRTGGSPGLGALGVLLAARTPADAALRTETVRRVLRDQEDTLRRSAQAAEHAEQVRETAETAARSADAAAEVVRTAHADAAAKVAEQMLRVDEFATRQARLLDELAAARNTSVELEQDRQEDLAAQTRQQAEEEARQSVPAANRPAPPRSGAEAAVAYAKAQLGKPYVWGGEGPFGYDCSGLVMQAWHRGGVALTHFAATQYAESRPVTYSELRPGDLVFWTETPHAEDIHHVAMYLGDSQMIHAPRTGDVIRISNMFSMGTPDYYARP